MTCKHPVEDALVAQLRAGVTLLDAPQPVRAAACEQTGVHTLRLTLTEGKYHQVKRMVAAAGNRVEALHRSRYGALALPARPRAGDLALGRRTRGGRAQHGIDGARVRQRPATTRRRIETAVWRSARQA